MGEEKDLIKVKKKLKNNVLFFGLNRTETGQFKPVSAFFLDNFGLFVFIDKKQTENDHFSILSINAQGNKTRTITYPRDT